MSDKSYGTESGTAEGHDRLEGHDGLTETPGGDILLSKEDIQRVASAGEIPDHEVDFLVSWLAHRLFMHRTFRRVIQGRRNPEGTRMKHLEKVVKASRRLDELLSVSWVKSDMWGHEREKAWEALNEGNEPQPCPPEYEHRGLLGDLVTWPTFEYDSPVNAGAIIPR